MLAQKRNKGLKISAELHNRLANSSEEIKEVDSEILAVRKSGKKRHRRPKTAEEYPCIHVYGF